MTGRKRGAAGQNPYEQKRGAAGQTPSEIEQLTERQDRLRRITITIVAGALILALYSMIFSFSAQDGEQSGGLSAYISERCVELLNLLSGKHWTESFMQSLAEYFEHPIRKLAHFGEYAALAMLIYILLRQWMDRGKKLFVIIVVWVFLSAAADEFHQYFVPGRWSSPADVLLDTCGGVFGMMCLVIAEKWRAKRRR